MLKIEVIKFEAQDIITTSGTPVVEDTPVTPNNGNCSCEYGVGEECLMEKHGNCPLGPNDRHNCEVFPEE